MELFPPAEPPPGAAPLAERMRPRSLSEFLGQTELVGEGSPLRRVITADRIPSMIFWGPPGSGKTTLASLIARETGCRFVAFSAVMVGVKEIRDVVREARAHAARGVRTILFLDEIHRFNKAQQDALLPHAESGLLTLIGATTENPSFEVNPALLSRCRVFTFEALADDNVAQLVDRAVSDEERGLGGRLTLEPRARAAIVVVANGDARAALNVLAMAADAVGSGEIAEGVVRDVCQSGKMLLFDKGGEEFYNLISALHKSIRGSDPQAALYWLARMLEAGADPLYVARRLVRAASEDIGNADPHALPLAVAAKDAVHFIGMPEGKAALAQIVTYLATAPKSNAVDRAYAAAARDALETRSDPVPLHIRNAPTGLMKRLGYGREYRYDHDHPDAYAAQEFLPEGLGHPTYYRPVERGFEREIKRRIAYWNRLKRERGVADRRDEGGAGEGHGAPGGDQLDDPTGGAR